MLIIIILLCLSDFFVIFHLFLHFLQTDKALFSSLHQESFSYLNLHRTDAKRFSCVNPSQTAIPISLLNRRLVKSPKEVLCLHHINNYTRLLLPHQMNNIRRKPLYEANSFSYGCIPQQHLHRKSRDDSFQYTLSLFPLHELW